MRSTLCVSVVGVVQEKVCSCATGDRDEETWGQMALDRGVPRRSKLGWAGGGDIRYTRDIRPVIKIDIRLQDILARISGMQPNMW